jgi:hypothetical protein
VKPKFGSRSEPAAQCKGHAFFAYANNYLIDTDHGVIVDVEATRAIRQAEVGAARTMLERTETRFGMKPASLAACGTAESLAWSPKRRKSLRRLCQSNGRSTACGTTSPSRTDIQAASARHSANPEKRLCL